MKSAIFLIGLLLFAGCIGSYTSIKDIKAEPEKYLGEKVTVKGTVKNSVKLGKLSGFTIESGNETIFISSGLLPPEGDEVIIEGTVMQEFLMGYYILAKDVSMT